MVNADVISLVEVARLKEREKGGAIGSRQGVVQTCGGVEKDEPEDPALVQIMGGASDGKTGTKEDL